MQTVLSKTGIEVCYPCTIHILLNGTNLDCEYKSDHIGRDLLTFICKIQNIEDIRHWGLKYMNTFCTDEQRYWLDLDKLIRTQVKNISPIRFYFRVKVYPAEPYKIYNQNIRQSIFQQLRLDFLGGRLFCEVNDAAMLTALILQYVHGDFQSSFGWYYRMYMESNVLRRERCTRQFYTATQKRAFELYERLLPGLTKMEVEDMFLRVGSKLISYGVEPFLVRNVDKQELRLCMNYTGMWTYNKGREVFRLNWDQISKITHECKGLFIHFVAGGVLVLECISFSECSYIWSIALDHLIQCTSPKPVAPDIGIDALSELTSFFGSCITEYKCTRFENDVFNEDLKLSCGLLNLSDWNSWMTQLCLMYIIIIICVMGVNTSVFDHLSHVWPMKNSLESLSDLIFNKILSY